MAWTAAIMRCKSGWPFEALLSGLLEAMQLEAAGTLPVTVRDRATARTCEQRVGGEIMLSGSGGGGLTIGE